MFLHLSTSVLLSPYHPQQKPWHPMNFRNRIKTWETEQQAIQAQKEKEKAQVGLGRIKPSSIAPTCSLISIDKTPLLTTAVPRSPLLKAEFDAEREYLQTVSLLSPEQQQQYRDRQSISFMYQV